MKNFDNVDKILAYHARLHGFADAADYKAYFDKFEKEKKKHGKTSKKYKDMEKWKEVGRTKKELQKLLGEK